MLYGVEEGMEVSVEISGYNISSEDWSGNIADGCSTSGRALGSEVLLWKEHLKY